MSPLASQIVGIDHSILVLRLPGSVTDEWCGQIQQEVQGRLPRVDNAGLILDFEAVELINSIGITTLLQLQEECRRRRAPLILAGVRPPIARFFRQVKLDNRFTLVATVDDALQRLGERA